MSMAIGFAAGLMSVWGAVWSVVWLVLNRVQWDLKRVQGRHVKDIKQKQRNLSGSAIADDRGARAVNGDARLKKRKPENGKVEVPRHEEAIEASHQHLSPTALDYEPGKDEEMEYFWQEYPETFTERFLWVLDLIVNFRLPGWNLAIPPLPTLPPSIKLKLGESINPGSESSVSSVGLIRYDTRRALLKARLPKFIIGYFLLDILKVIMMNDPYFIFGPTTYALPWYLRSQPPIMLQFIRQFISSWSIIISLEMVFLLCPLGMSLLLGPKILGQRGHAWYYPTTWGRWSNVMNKGLNGLWGSWWHQTFRFAFSAPSNYLIKNGYIRPHSTLARMSALFFAFAISGVIHAGGSITQFPKTYWWNCPIFFLLQAPGVLLQMTFCSLLHPVIRKFPPPIRQAGNFAYTFFWLLYTGWWLTDDFARGGMWLYEPIPLSPLRGMGFGERDAGWWCWEHIGVGWYTGRHWWESGIAF